MAYCIDSKRHPLQKLHTHCLASLLAPASGSSCAIVSGANGSKTLGDKGLGGNGSSLTREDPVLDGPSSLAFPPVSGSDTEGVPEIGESSASDWNAVTTPVLDGSSILLVSCRERE